MKKTRKWRQARHLARCEKDKHRPRGCYHGPAVSKEESVTLHGVAAMMLNFIRRERLEDRRTGVRGDR